MSRPSFAHRVSRGSRFIINLYQAFKFLKTSREASSAHWIVRERIKTMATFRPLNVIFDDNEESEEEIDDSKELQIEEALKLYQNALKLHSQGPGFFLEAEEAYNDLFRSEVFKYPESLSEEKWLEAFGDGDIDEDAVDPDIDINLPVTALDTNPNSLPQILYLAHKNFGQFRLDKLRFRIARLEQELTEGRINTGQGNAEGPVDTGLEHLSEALGRDDSDLELWRRVSRLSEYLGSRRLARFCLESVLYEDGDVTADELDFSNLEQRFAAERLEQIIQNLEDERSESQLRELLIGRKTLARTLRSLIDPCPFLPETQSMVAKQIRNAEPSISALTPSECNWIGLGEAILLQLEKVTEKSNAAPGTGTLCYFHARVDSTEVAGTQSSVQEAVHSTDTESSVMITDDPATKEAVEDVEAAEEVTTPIEKKDITLDMEDVVTVPGLHEARLTSEEPAIGSNKGNDDDDAVHGDSDVHENVAAETVTEGPIVNLSPRKRSSEEAELLEANDSTRVRSKRIKARKSANESLGKGESSEDAAQWYSKQLEIYTQADDIAFQFIDKLLRRLHCKTIGSVEDLKIASQSDVKINNETIIQANPGPQRTMKRLLESWDQSKSRAFVKGGGLLDLSKTAESLGLSNILSMSIQNGTEPIEVSELTDEHISVVLAIASGPQCAHTIEELALYWLQGLLSPKSDGNRVSLYASYQWSTSLKSTVVELLVHLDVYIWKSINERVEYLPFEFVQTIFELHLDIYGRMTNPGSKADQATRDAQHDRLSRWSRLANHIAGIVGSEESATLTSLELRFLWSTVVSNVLLAVDSGISNAALYQELVRILQLQRDFTGSGVVIRLPNNAMVPEISIAAAEKEISRITMMNFFETIFNSNDKEAFSVIEKLQPLLDLFVLEDFWSVAPVIVKDGTNGQPDTDTLPALSTADPALLDALEYLKQSNVSFKLFLWQKLRDAYGLVNFPPMILSCNLRIFALLVEQLHSPSFGETHNGKDLEPFLQYLHKIDDLLTPILSHILTNTKALDCVDNDQIRSFISSGTALLQMLHVFALWEDSIRVGQIPAPAQPGSAGIALQTKSAEKFRDMTIRVWCLLYLIIKDAISQNTELFPNHSEDLLTTLRLVHNSLGARTYCSFGSKMLLKLEQSEMNRLRGANGWDVNMPQVIFDLFGLRISCNTADIEDHACEPVDVDKKTALEILDAVILQANRLSMKDLLKHDLRFAIDKVQQVIKVPRISDSASPRAFNKRLVNNYLKTAINPTDIFRAGKGEGDLNSMRVTMEGSEVAKKGWYFLLGNIALTKFRSQKRITAAATEDLENARMFFKLDLEFNTEKWETWFRLGQVFDSLLDEQTTWTADKLDRDQSALVEMQRSAILCYNMSLAIARRTENVSLDEAGKMADLCKEYGNRVYSSSREPFSMKAFALQDFERLYNREHSGMYSREPFRPLTLYRAWKLAATLLQRACRDKPTDWTTWYALGKVLWKMHSCSEENLNHARRVPYQAVINALVHAVDNVPDKRDNKHSDKDPVLEPHYKLLVIVHKMFKRHTVAVDEACQILEATPFSRLVTSIQDPEEWIDYMQEILSAMKAADKSNWHHRLAARAAMTIYETDPEDPRTWLGAKHELTQQIFTKAMTIQVWRPEHERCGRHFVYTGRYVHFLLEILYKLKDKESVEALARRIRKKSGDFVNHLSVWNELCRVFLLILRERIEGQIGQKIEQNFDETYFKNVNLEEFQANAARIEAWINKPTTVCDEVEILQDAIEFKKLNNKLLKDSEVETTIADIYTAIYLTHAERLRQKETEEENRERMRVDTILSNPITADAASKEASPMPEQEPTKRRFNVITHREVIRRAEALMTKPPPIATPKTAHQILPSISNEPIRTPGIAVVIPSRRNSHENISAPATPTSVHSIHDSADDESELSDLDEEEGGGFESVQDEEEEREQEEGIEEAAGRDPPPPPQPRRASIFPNIGGFSAANEAAASIEDDANEDAGSQAEEKEDDGSIEQEAMNEAEREAGGEGPSADVDMEDVEEDRAAGKSPHTVSAEPEAARVDGTGRADGGGGAAAGTGAGIIAKGQDGKDGDQDMIMD